MEVTIKKCDICKNSCQPLPSGHHIPSSEWYCPKCHKSYPMPEEEAKFWYGQLSPKQ